MTSTIIEKLNELLEAERAGVAAVSALFPQATDQEMKETLEKVRDDEAWSCAGLHDRIVALKGSPSPNTGDFADRLKALGSLLEQLEFLSRGQRWVVRRIDGLLEQDVDTDTSAFLRQMKDVHQRNIDWCDAQAQQLRQSG